MIYINIFFQNTSTTFTQAGTSYIQLHHFYYKYPPQVSDPFNNKLSLEYQYTSCDFKNRGEKNVYKVSGCIFVDDAIAKRTCLHISVISRSKTRCILCSKAPCKTVNCPVIAEFYLSSVLMQGVFAQYSYANCREWRTLQVVMLILVKIPLEFYM